MILQPSVRLCIVESMTALKEQGWQASMVFPGKPVAGVLHVALNRIIPLSEPASVPPIPSESASQIEQCCSFP
jgi:hypothetical protein